MIDKIIALLLGELFKKKPWALWAIKMDDIKWTKIGEGSMRRLKMYAATLMVEGWRTIIVAKGIIPVPPPKSNKENIS
jgi:hypothetical protein